MDEDIKQLASQRDKHVAEASHGWQSKLRRTGNHGIKRGIFNIMVYLDNDENLKGLLSFDEFTDQIFKLRDSPAAGLHKGTWTDADDSLLRAYLDKEHDVVFSKDNVTDALVAVSQEKSVNPMKERIESVKWDGQKRAEAFFIDYLGAEDTHYTREVTRKWLAGAVARVYQPGVKFEIIPILEGPQGIGKSTTVRLLAPDYFNDSMKGMGKHKDDYQQLLGSWIIEIAELSAMRKTDIEGIKNFTSARSDYYRNSYGRVASQHPRKNVFIGTTNQTDYLKDATGERRFYPIKCGVNKATKNPWNADPNDVLQILAEAKTWVDNHEKLYFDRKTLQEAAGYQREAQAVNPMKDAIMDYLAMQVPTNWDSLTNSVKRSYFSKVMDNEDVQDADWLNVKLSPERAPLQQTATQEILAVVFNKRSDSYLSGSINSDAKKIKLIMDNAEGWNYNANVIVSGKRQRGYKRI
ncbi:MAG TPA: virulence-associated E family protein [Candidatus Levilactobacillus faecigallinarum]|uniref:Virulence-associated E family protein n=1 Tax=Candidatus Levilactobacillus faecigallinarum TaxID=2838638 RepID=A0A9D1QTG0_9LACO|nr:virulence-associated E family protein [Candidatus Levilactobacillus faecigallinarum]